jgi:hypothetical protein
MVVMQNASSGVKRVVLGRFHRLWCFLFGFIYYAFKGCWGWAFISFFTLNGIFVLLPLFNRGVLVRNYENSGWRVMDE